MGQSGNVTLPKSVLFRLSPIARRLLPRPVLRFLLLNSCAEGGDCLVCDVTLLPKHH